MTAQCGLPCNVDVRTPRRKENGDIRPFAYAQFAVSHIAHFEGGRHD